MALDPYDTWLAVSDVANHTVFIYSVDPSTGAVGDYVAATDISAVADGITFKQGGGQVVVSSNDSAVRTYDFPPSNGQIFPNAAQEFPTPGHPGRITNADLNDNGAVSPVSSCHWAVIQRIVHEHSAYPARSNRASCGDRDA